MRNIIKAILKKLHLYGIAKATVCAFRCCQYRCSAAKRRRFFWKEFDELLKQARLLKIVPGGIVATGLLCTPHKPTLMAFLSQLQQCLPQQQIVLLDERKQPTDCPFARLTIPRSIPLQYDHYLKFPTQPEIKQQICEKPFLQDVVVNLLRRHQDMYRSYAETLACTVYRLYSEILALWKPGCVIIWNEFSPLHTLCAQACREKGIQPLFWEFGVLPGTFAMDRAGQMGKSNVTIQCEKFIRLTVKSDELEKAREVLAYLRKSGLNRNVQPVSGDMASVLRSQLKPGRPVVLFAGQNDFDSGLVPYAEESRAFHSPIFESSLEVVDVLAALANKNGWNFIFKPHPGMVEQYEFVEYAANVIYVCSIDLNKLIDLSDVVVTIASQTAYVALVRDRPVVLLGYNQLKGKGCAYEAYVEDVIENRIKEALCCGQTPEQRERFLHHTAQLLNDYLFDDLADRPIRYGRRLEQVIQKGDTVSAFMQGVERWNEWV